MKQKSRRVYSTETGRICPDCDFPKDSCQCSKLSSNSAQVAHAFVRLSRETKGRKGAGVTLITDLPFASPEELKNTAKTIKQLCSSGGAIKNGIIEIQGDHRDKIEQWLVKAGHKVKRVGG